MNKLVIIISLLILFSNNCFAKEELKFFIGENKIDLEGYFIQGGYVKGKTSSKIKIKFENRDVYLGKKNKFILGFGRDYSEVANLKFFGYQKHQLLHHRQATENLEKYILLLNLMFLL